MGYLREEVRKGVKQSKKGINLCSILQNDGTFSEENIVDEIIALFITAHKTVSLTTANLLIYLDMNPQVN